MPQSEQAFCAHSENTMTRPSTIYLRKVKEQLLHGRMSVQQKAQNLLCLSFLKSVLDFLTRADSQWCKETMSVQAELKQGLWEPCMFFDHIKETMRQCYPRTLSLYSKLLPRMSGAQKLLFSGAMDSASITRIFPYRKNN